MTHIFISYSSKHRPLTEALAAALEAKGWPVWWDHALEAYGPYEAQIREAIGQAGALVVIWSEGAAASLFVGGEVEAALAARKLVNLRAPEFPIDGVPLNYRALQCTAIDLAELGPVLSTIETVWQGRVPDGVTPFHITHAARYGPLIDPKRAALPDDPAELTPSALLQAKFEVVPYVDATGLVADTLDWCFDAAAYAERPRASAGRSSKMLQKTLSCDHFGEAAFAVRFIQMCRWQWLPVK